MQTAFSTGQTAIKNATYLLFSAHSLAHKFNAFIDITRTDVLNNIEIFANTHACRMQCLGSFSQCLLFVAWDSCKKNSTEDDKHTHAKSQWLCRSRKCVCEWICHFFSSCGGCSCFSLTSSLNGCLGQGYRLNTFDRIDFTTNACMHWMCVCPRVSVIVFVSFVTKFGIRSDHLFRVSEWQHFQYMPWFILATDRFHYFIVC